MFAAKSTFTPAATLVNRLARSTRAFARDESGTLTAFSMIIFLLMIAIAGLTIDLMRHESIRTRLQATSDRAVLASADLDQTADAKAVVRDYFAKAGMEEFIQDIQVDQGINYKTVDVTVGLDMPTWFMNMSGIDTLPNYTYSKAEERIQNIEVSLILDISGSMGWDSAEPNKSKIEVLRGAAKTFATTMMDGNSGDTSITGLTSVSIVPYHAVVNVPDMLLNKINVEEHQTASNCVRFRSSEFDVLTLSTSSTYKRLSHFDRNNDDYYEVAGFPTLERPWCQSDDYGEILMHSISETELHNTIDGLGARGNTAIDLGVKWGAALLDPSTQPFTQDLSGNGGPLDSEVSDRPKSYTDTETIKVMVLMTDGENTSQYDLKNSFKGTAAPVWYSEDEEEYSVYFQSRQNAGQRPYWIPPTKADGTPDVYYKSNEKDYVARTSNGRWEWSPSGSDAEQLTHTDIFSTFNVRFLSNYLFRTDKDWGGQKTLRNKYRNAVTKYTGPDTADTYTKKICDQLIDENVVIFTIAFEAPSRGRDLMQYCASQPGNYFDVQGADIESAFSSIADTIQQLRLTF